MTVADIPRYCIFRGQRCRVLYYDSDNRFRILLPDDTQRTVDRSEVEFLK